MTQNTDSLEFALVAAHAAAPDLDRAALDAAVTAATEAFAGQTRSLQAALRSSTDSVSVERDILASAQLWVVQHDTAELSELKDILGGHTTYGFEPTGVSGLDPATIAEAATEAYLREFARAESLQRLVLAAGI